MRPAEKLSYRANLIASLIGQQSRTIESFGQHEEEYEHYIDLMRYKAESTIKMIILVSYFLGFAFSYVFTGELVTAIGVSIFFLGVLSLILVTTPFLSVLERYHARLNAKLLREVEKNKDAEVAAITKLQKKLEGKGPGMVAIFRDVILEPKFDLQVTLEEKTNICDLSSKGKGLDIDPVSYGKILKCFTNLLHSDSNFLQHKYYDSCRSNVAVKAINEAYFQVETALSRDEYMPIKQLAYIGMYALARVPKREYEFNRSLVDYREVFKLCITGDYTSAKEITNELRLAA